LGGLTAKQVATLFVGTGALMFASVSFSPWWTDGTAGDTTETAADRSGPDRGWVDGIEKEQRRTTKSTIVDGSPEYVVVLKPPPDPRDPGTSEERIREARPRDPKFPQPGVPVEKSDDASRMSVSDARVPTPVKNPMSVCIHQSRSMASKPLA